MSTPARELASALVEGACLLGTSSTPSNSPDLKSILRGRLLKYYACLECSDGVKELKESSLEEVQLLTAKEAFSVVQKIHNALDIEDAKTDKTPDQVPSIGTRDLAQLRTLLSLIFKWGIEPLFNRVALALLGPSINTTKARAKITDASQNLDDYRFLSEFVTSLFLLIFPRGVQGQISQTLITTTIMSRHASELLNPSIAMGWLPERLSSSSLPIIHEMRVFIIHFLKFLSPAQAISALGTIISVPCPAHVRKISSFLLTKQLLRPHGVQGLFDVMFGKDPLEDGLRLQKQEHIARTLMTVPTNMKATEYYSLIFPRVIHLISSNIPSHRQAASFTIYRAIVPEKQEQYQSASSIVLTMLHGPFLKLVDASGERPANTMEPSEALSSIITLISNTEPSPIFISKILSPILASLYLLSYNLAQYKTTDPQLKASVSGILLSWGKIVDQPEGTNTLRSILERGKNSEWRFNTDGRLRRFQLTKGPSSLSVLMPNDVRQDADSDIDTNLFDFYPDPAHFVDFLRTIERGDIASDIFIQNLESYRNLKSDANEDSMRTLHRLQIIIQMQKKLLSEDTPSNILRIPDHLLSFILHVLESATIPVRNNADDGFKDEHVWLGVGEDEDSDDEAPGSEIVGPDDEMIETAINLLLAILEANDKSSTSAYPIFHEIFSRMEILAINGSSSIRPLAREARLVITARLAHAPALNTLSSHEERAQETYQKALKLLQDPILPVRAHGILLLRHLVSPPASDRTMVPEPINQSLVPAILSIFLQSIQDDDSYIFLNAVQGLAAMVDTFGKDVLQNLMYDYASGLDGLGAGNLSQQDVDIRTRVGEALNMVINRCGSALGIYVDILVPRLFAIVRSSDIPTILRTSSLSLLSTCVNTFPLAILPYVEDISSAMIDLLQVEGVALPHDHKPTNHSEPLDNPETMDSNPTSKNPKFPPLRRAAIHFLSLLILAATRELYNQPGTDVSVIFPRVLFDRLRVTLGYVSSSDVDNVVRIMARDATESLKQLQQAVLEI